MAIFFKKLFGLGNKINIRQADKQVDEDEHKSTDEMDVQPIIKSEFGEWLGGDYDEGQLSIDVFQTSDSLIVKSTIAGVKPDDIDISINNDMLTIRGRREIQENISEENYLIKECYWGGFSRSVILPVEVEVEKIEAALDNGVLTIILPKAKSAKQFSIKVKES
ncbi:Hsp20/alpha crystallin family protein [Patescibacteria group bacterium]|nr:Hsp20/alpha crystallin family protein [Patescibacteria group bacterium]MBU1662992.1 Hsp20/alpha crystallin family protein [Patescibacteria group bacterium]MBU1934184.1 Hsp20/alpha crystallin family protein [Patescibacteria group bacterium]MBU2008167.1 Hsp20/alpha crystallin family protein [Patescibacteria group bacterium]MBU2233650.1 Hsp20/alpha crystallin family protein [Patescibacteria group bacterium]